MRYFTVIIAGIVLSACGATTLGPVGAISLPGDASWGSSARIEGDAPAWTESRQRILLPGEVTPERIEGDAPEVWVDANVILPSDPEWDAPADEAITNDARHAELEVSPSL